MKVKKLIEELKKLEQEKEINISLKRKEESKIISILNTPTKVILRSYEPFSDELA